MIVTRTYRQDDTHTTTDDDDGAALANIIYATSSPRQRNTTSGTLTATLRAGIDRAGCNSNDNHGPRQQTKLARTNGSALILSASGDEILASIITVRSQASPKVHHIVVHIMDGCALGAPAAGILIAPRCRTYNTKALHDDRCFGQRRGKAISSNNPMRSGRHFDLEVKMSEPTSQPRSLALMTHTFKALPAGRYGITRRYPLGRIKALFMQMFAYLLLFPRYPPLLLLLRLPCVRAVVSNYRNGPPGWAPPPVPLTPSSHSSSDRSLSSRRPCHILCRRCVTDLCEGPDRSIPWSSAVARVHAALAGTTTGPGLSGMRRRPPGTPGHHRFRQRRAPQGIPALKTRC